MKNVVVIGGSGFIGSHLADQLTTNGYNVTIFDNHVSSWKKENQEFILGDILNFKLLCEIIKGKDIVYNFAALADLDYLIKNPQLSVETNILGNVNVLEACVRNNIQKFIYASSMYVYSRQGSFYRCSKQSSELYIDEYNKLHNLNYTILRYGSLYGPRSNDKNSIFRIIKKAIRDKKITYKGYPSAMREYIHVLDAAKTAVQAIDKSFDNQAFVITGQEAISVIDMLKMLAEILGIEENNIEILNQPDMGHYKITPYSYSDKSGKKYIPKMHVDLGYGLLELIEILTEEKQKA